MRCLTLAHALRDAGHQITFISRQLQGHLCDYIELQGFSIARLPCPAVLEQTQDWLSVPWERDARETAGILNELPRTSWLVVDHYCLDARWEDTVRTQAERILAIDDLADRQHDCDLLLDSNYGRDAMDYLKLVPSNCRLLIGPRYAMLRREFSEWRERSLARLRWPINRILISMGGVDRTDATSMALDALDANPRTVDAEKNVIMGQHSPWLTKISRQAANMPHTHVHVSVGNMAEFMANSDLAIGAAGSTSWERCCLGLPTLAVILADNQRLSASALDAAGVQVTVGEQGVMNSRLAERLSQLDEHAMTNMSLQARALVDGFGVRRALEAMNAW